MNLEIDNRMPWFHGSDREFELLAEGSTITQWRELAEAFSHKPAILSVSDEGEIRHNGARNGILYQVDEPLAEADIIPHPRTTMPPNAEFLTTRPLRLRPIAETGGGVAQSSFFSMVLRMKYINRWGLMRNSREESLSEHSLDVAVLAHALAVIGKRRLGRGYDPQRAAMLALYHDASEIITGDMPTPVKYHDEKITRAYKQVESAANGALLSMLPEDLRGEYETLFEKHPDDAELWKLVKAADKLSALIKCVEEESSGNREFVRAKRSTLEAIGGIKLPELEIFMAEFYDSFTKTLDEQ